MLDAIKSLFQSSMQPPRDAEPETGDQDIRLAACALLLELAWADDEFSEDERQHLESAIRRHYGLDQEQAETLIQTAETARSSATDVYQFTRLIRAHYSLGQKMVLAEIMWGLVFADGDLSSREDYLMRKLSNLLDLQMTYLSEARSRARSAPGDTGGPFLVD